MRKSTDKNNSHVVSSRVPVCREHQAINGLTVFTQGLSGRADVVDKGFLPKHRLD